MYCNPAYFCLGIIFLTLIIDIKMEEMIQNDTKEINGMRFPIDLVFEWSDIEITKEIGKGNFGKVSQGHLNLSQFRR